MGAIFTALSGWLAAIFARLFTLMVNNYIATKIILGALFIVILPIILNNFIYYLLSDIFTSVEGYTQGVDPGIANTVTFTSLGAYMVEQLGILSAFSIIINAITCRWVLSWIPFVGPR